MGRHPSILVIEDDDDMRALLHHILTAAGMSVVVTGDGETALDEIAGHDFDMVVTDVRLPPPMDGLETIRRARSDCPSLKSLFISAWSGPVGDNPYLDDFVAKPFNHRQLLGCVWELLLRQPRHVATQLDDRRFSLGSDSKGLSVTS
jgi:two-component system OmpR family response regulator